MSTCKEHFQLQKSKVASCRAYNLYWWTEHSLCVCVVVPPGTTSLCQSLLKELHGGCFGSLVAGKGLYAIMYQILVERDVCRCPHSIRDAWLLLPTKEVGRSHIPPLVEIFKQIWLLRVPRPMDLTGFLNIYIICLSNKIALFHQWFFMVEMLDCWQKLCCVVLSQSHHAYSVKSGWLQDRTDCLLCGRKHN